MLARSAPFKRVFGAYTNIPWGSTNTYRIEDSETFLFSRRNDHTFKKIPVKKDAFEVCHYQELLPCFGLGDLMIVEDCDSIKESV